MHICNFYVKNLNLELEPDSYLPILKKKHKNFSESERKSFEHT